MKMKKQMAILSLALSCLAGMGIVGCGPSKADKMREAREDSIRMADSIAKVEAERIEQARQDSIMRDSVIRTKIPQMKDIAGYQSEYDGVPFYDFEKISRKLKKQGYDEIVNKSWVPGHYNDALGEYEEGYYKKDYVWTCDSDVNIKVVTGEGLITLTFGDEYTQQLFMESVKAAGFKKGKGEYGGWYNSDNRAARGTVYHHPKGHYWCGVWVDETPGKVYLVYDWTY